MSVNIDEGRIRAILRDVSNHTPGNLKWTPLDRRVNDDSGLEWSNRELSVDPFDVGSSAWKQEQVIAGLRAITADGLQSGEVAKFVRDNFVSPEDNAATYGFDLLEKQAGNSGRMVTDGEQEALRVLTEKLEWSLREAPDSHQ